MTPAAPLPKYSRLENERRFLVDPASDWRSRLSPYARRVEDRYLACGLLRLRCLTDLDSGRIVYKLTKKYTGTATASQPIATLFLSGPEYRAFQSLPGRELEKTRRYIDHESRVYAVDTFAGALTGLVTCEIETDTLTELESLAPPPWAACEITTDPFFTGGQLSMLSPGQLQQNPTARAHLHPAGA